MQRLYSTQRLGVAVIAALFFLSPAIGAHAVGARQTPVVARINFDQPWSMAADSEGRLYVADRLNYRVVEFSTVFAQVKVDQFAHRIVDHPERVIKRRSRLVA